MVAKAKSASAGAAASKPKRPAFKNEPFDYDPGESTPTFDRSLVRKPLFRYLGKFEEGEVEPDDWPVTVHMEAHHHVQMAITPQFYPGSSGWIEKIKARMAEMADHDLPAQSNGAFHTLDPSYTDEIYRILMDGVVREDWGQWLANHDARIGARTWDLYATGDKRYWGRRPFFYNSYLGPQSRAFVELSIFDDATMTLFKLAFGGK
ncbi:hypothetical protein [Qipengyuania atrilutea]|uniref:Uncharacterized protein n=1 Tax=Qipengyuania atrilutea TaxID=2744473 RepID=A0A850H2P2_9SPHN|nr:hypothetical protein [Actirhodobacter atriluteus]NVD44847.1 hypothetical protein [Actirhodobacter atriluteus]